MYLFTTRNLITGSLYYYQFCFSSEIEQAEACSIVLMGQCERVGNFSVLGQEDVLFTGLLSSAFVSEC